MRCNYDVIVFSSSFNSQTHQQHMAPCSQLISDILKSVFQFFFYGGGGGGVSLQHQRGIPADSCSTLIKPQVCCLSLIAELHLNLIVMGDGWSGWGAVYLIFFWGRWRCGRGDELSGRGRTHRSVTEFNPWSKTALCCSYTVITHKHMQLDVNNKFFNDIFIQSLKFIFILFKVGQR